MAHLGLRHDASGHDHHAHGDAPEHRLKVALVLTVTMMVVEAVGGVASRSLALLSDAGHMLADAGALGLALVAQRIAARPRSPRRTYGYRRAEILAAFANGITLGVTAALVIVEALERLREPPEVRGGLMLVIAALGLLINLLAARVLTRGDSGHNPNTRAALAHVLSDAAGSAAALGAGVCVVVFGWPRADPIVSLAISVLILWSAWTLVWRTARVLMESIPRGLAVEALEGTIRSTPGVADLHDLHAWTISEGFDVLTVHVVLDGSRHGTEVAREVGRRVRAEHGIDHVTVQPEAPAPALVQPVVLQPRRRADR